MLDIDSPTSKAELEDAFDVLVKEAHDNGVDVDNGGYELIHQEPAIPDWDLTIIRMA